MIYLEKFKLNSTILLLFVLMTSMGFIASIRGPILPVIQDEFCISFNSIGILIFFTGLGGQISFFFSGFGINKYGTKSIIVLGLFLMIISLIGIKFTYSIFYFVFFYTLVSIAFGCVVLGLNTMGSQMKNVPLAVILNITNLFFGLGALLGPQYAKLMFVNDFRWQSIFSYISIPMIILCLSTILIYKKHDKSDSIIIKNRDSIFNTFKNKLVWIFALIFAFCQILELGISSWLAIFLKEYYNFSEVLGADYISYFFMSFTIGRVVGGFFSERLGYINTVLYAAMSGGLLVFLGIFMGKSFAILIPISGAFVSIFYPTLAASVFDTFKKKGASFLGTITMIGGIINMTTNWIVGVVSDSYGILAGFLIVATSSIGIIVGIMYLKNYSLKANIETK